MKKIISIVLAVILVLSLSACGTTSPAPAKEEKTENNENIILIDPVYVPVDDKNLKMEITSVSIEENNDGAYFAYRVNYTVTNKSEEHDVRVSTFQGNCSVGSYSVEFDARNNSTKSGKINDTGCFVCTVSNNGGLVSDGAEHIESLEDLLQFEATVNIDVYDYDGKSNNIVDKYTVPVSLSSHDN